VNESLDRLESLFAAALPKPLADRAAYLDQACADDPALRERVEALLGAHAAAGDFLESPAPSPVVTIEELPVGEGPGTAIGPYRLIEQIGEGGMGTVWMAQQTEPVRRLVAVKLIKAGMDSRQVIARFEAERQALALMDHANIARVLEAGTSGAGRPYFVMDLVKGVPITRYCDEHHLTPRQRLELFIPVCQAVQHAHQKGIIHRDLKPSNVLVALSDGQPVPKVIDFGVAKAAGQSLTDKTLVTGFGNIVGTLEYMSPEQAQINQIDIDTRSDIYSLGVLLYELLTGSPPFSRTELEKAGMLEMLRVIREQEPSKPSTKLSTAEGLPTLAANRGTEPAKLTRLVRGELDWIVMKALEKDRSRRYETANGFAMDVQRYLADEQVQACPPSPWYRFRKFVRRNNRAVLAALLILLALVAGVIGTTWGLIRAEQQRLVVERQRNELAERNQALQAAHEQERLLNERAREAIETLTSETAIEQLTREKELRPEIKDFLDKMIQYYAESTQAGGATEQERLRQARAYSRMGRMHQTLGRSQDGENAYRRAVALGQQLAVDFPTRPEYRQELASSHNRLGVLLRATGRLPKAEAAFTEALAILKQLAADFPTRPEFRQALAGINNNLGNLLVATARLPEAEAAHAEALAIRKQLVADFPDRPVFRRALAMSHNNLGWLFQSTKRVNEAEAAFRDAVAVQKLVVADVPNQPEFHLDLAKYESSLGHLLRDSGRLKEAEAVYGEALPIEKQLAADFPSRPQFRQELSVGLNHLGHLLRDTGQLKEAEAAYAEALAIQRRLAADFPEIPDYRNDLTGTLFNLANAAGRRRDFAASRRWLDEAFPYHREVLQADPRNPEYRWGYRNSLGELAQSCSGLGDRPAALAAATKQRDLGWEPAADAYEAARMLARCAPIVEKNDKLDVAKRQAEMQLYADQAMAMLRDAVVKGYKDAARMKKDKELEPLQEREDFKKMVAELEAAKHAPPKKP
jgi:eukaryotic-like serine/threonine-protein kinase